jgi:hypothetical protein
VTIAPGVTFEVDKARGGTNDQEWKFLQLEGAVLTIDRTMYSHS